MTRTDKRPRVKYGQGPFNGPYSTYRHMRDNRKRIPEVQYVGFHRRVVQEMRGANRIVVPVPLT